MKMLYLLLAGYLLLANVAAFAMYGMDKEKAQRDEWRIPEAQLIGAAFAGGALGALLGMKHFHHKTRKLKFRICVPLALGLWVAVMLWLGLGLQ